MSKVEELLKRYLPYKHAVNVYERHKPMPSAGIANYSQECQWIGRTGKILRNRWQAC
jgi:hypothetical protein